MLTLAGKVGRLIEHYGDGQIEANLHQLNADLLEVFRQVLAAADEADVSLDEAARRNLAKTIGRWPTPEFRKYDPPYDVSFDTDERLPDVIEMTFKEKEVAGKKYVLQQCHGINVGDRLTDNKFEPDDYRFHDVFHLAYATYLGWSPVLRALFKLKRKSDPLIDENEDGARAILIEEGIATWIFNHGVRNHLFRTTKSLDYGLLRAVRELVIGFEVDSRPLWQWEEAILKGFEIFRLLKEHRGGIVTADIARHELRFRK